MNVTMTFAYVEAYAAARSCLGALADISDFDDSCRFERLLLDLARWCSSARRAADGLPLRGITTVVTPRSCRSSSTFFSP